MHVEWSPVKMHSVTKSLPDLDLVYLQSNEPVNHPEASVMRSMAASLPHALLCCSK